jgi:hypothetical protein
MIKIPKVTVTYKGQALTYQFFDEHPEIHHMYPSRKNFISHLYKLLLDKAQISSEKQVIEISENLILVNGKQVILK